MPPLRWGDGGLRMGWPFPQPPFQSRATSILPRTLRRAEFAPVNVLPGWPSRFASTREQAPARVSVFRLQRLELFFASCLTPNGSWTYDEKARRLTLTLLIAEGNPYTYTLTFTKIEADMAEGTL